MEKNELQAAGTGAARNVCQCPYPSCPNSAEKLNGDRYCTLDLPTTEPIEIGKLRNGDRFSFGILPYLFHTFVGNFGEYVQYRKECGWTIETTDLKRIVNRVVTKTNTNKN